MENTLYNKYRPKKIKDIVGQGKIVKTIENAVSAGRELSHAMLLTGPAGCGKTSMARILSCIANSDPYGVDYDPTKEPYSNILDGSYMDFIEIDAATKTSIDDVRDIKSAAIERPMVLKKKIFVIDEIQAWRKGSSAASGLLKILEEPPPFVMFILATTEPDKIMPTIKSRCEIYQFDKIMMKDMSSAISNVATSEGVENLTQDILDVIARAAGGSLRNALTILQSVINRCGKNVDYKSVIEVVGVSDHVLIHNTMEAIFGSSLKDVIYNIKLMVKNGNDPHFIFHALSKYLDDMMVAKAYKSHSHLFLPDSIRATWEKRMENTDMGIFINLIDKINHFSARLSEIPNPEASLDACVMDMAIYCSKKQ